MSHDPTEHVQEHLQHEAAHGGHGDHSGGANKWITAAALTAAFLAAFAAVSASLATSHLTQSTLKRIAANDQWNYYQAKSIKNSLIDGRLMEYNVAFASAGGKLPDDVAKQHEDDLAKQIEYNLAAAKEKNPAKPKGMLGIQLLAEGLEGISGEHLDAHETYEMSATLFHIAIAIVAIAVVAKRKEFWYLSMVGGVIGLCFFGYAYANAPAAEHEHAEAAEHSTTAPGHTAPAGEHAAAGEHAPAADHKPAPEEHAPAVAKPEPH